MNKQINYVAKYPIKTKVRKYFPYCGWFSGEVTEISVINATTLYYTVKYDDGDEEELDEAEIGQLLKTEAAYDNKEADEERKSFVWVTIGKRKYPGKLLATKKDGYHVKCTNSGIEFIVPSKVEKKVNYQQQYILAAEFHTKNTKNEDLSSPNNKKRRIDKTPMKYTQGKLLWDSYTPFSINKIVTNISNILPNDLKKFAKNIGAYCLFAYARQCLSKRARDDGDADNVVANNMIFQEYSFQEMYRELDRSSCYFHSQMIDLYNKRNKPQSRYEWVMLVLWASYCFRQVQKVETFIEFKNNAIPTVEEFDEYKRFVKRKKDSREVFFVGTHQTPTFDQYISFLSQTLKNDGELLKSVAKEITNIINNAELKKKNHSNNNKDNNQEGQVLRQCFKNITRLPGLGSFFGWQVTCDLIESNCFKISNIENTAYENGFCEIGPGAKSGILLIFPNVNHKKYSNLDLATLLHKKLNEVFDSDLLLLSNNKEKEFPKWNKKSLSLKNIEHSLCEYSKYISREEKRCRSTRVSSIENENKELVELDGVDFDKPCKICNLQDTETDGLFCDSCLNFYCKHCEKESYHLSPISFICSLCKQFDQIQFTF